MLKNVFSPLSGGMAQERMMEILSNNMANAQTTGFKEQFLALRGSEANPWPAYASPLAPAQFKEDMRELFPLHGNEFAYVALAEVVTDLQQGSLRTTGSPTDFAIEGSGFFVVETTAGEMLTRDGSFLISPEGVLVARDGSPVMGEQGALSGLAHDSIEVLATGEVYSGGRFVDRLLLVDVEDSVVLQQVGGNRFVDDGPPENRKPVTCRIAQGVLESSNVNPMRNMTQLILAHRSYEAMQKALQAHDESMQTASQKLGKTEA